MNNGELLIDMKKITYKITDPLGIHARPAGLLVKKLNQYVSVVTIEKDGVQKNAKRILSLMSLGVKQNETVTLIFEGPDEEEAAGTALAFLQENF